MNAKIMTALLATFVMLFAGVAVADTVDAGEPTSYKVTYTVNGTEYVKSGATESVTLETIESLGAKLPDGVTFVQWNIDGAKYNAGSTYIFSNATPIEAKPIYKATTYTANFMDGDKAVCDPVTGTIVKGDAVTGIVKLGANDSVPTKTAEALSEKAPANPEKDGFIFLGWVAEGAPEGTEPVEKAKLPALKADVTYKAVWAVDYKLTFVDGTTTYKTIVSQMIVPDLGVKEGFNFLGWFVGNEQVTFVEKNGKFSTDYEFTEDTTLNAKWEPINCYVTFVAGDFSKTVPVLYGDKVAMLALPEGYESWNFDFETAITEDVTIEAVVAPEPEPEGLDDPVTQTVVILGGLLVIIIFALLVSKVKKGEIVVKLKKDKEDEE